MAAMEVESFLSLRSFSSSPVHRPLNQSANGVTGNVPHSRTLPASERIRQLKTKLLQTLNLLDYLVKVNFHDLRDFAARTLASLADLKDFGNFL